MPTVNKNNIPDASDVLLVAFVQTFPSDLYDPLINEYKGINLSDKNDTQETAKEKMERQNHKKESALHIRRPFTLATSFFGLPNSYYPKNRQNKDVSIGELLIKNLTGWKDEDSDAYNLFFSPFFLIKNVVVAAYKTVFNIAKVFTEFLPTAAANLLKTVAAYSENEENSILYAAAMMGHVFFQAVAFVGRAITSPIQGVRFAFKIGELVEEQLGKGSRIGKIAGLIVGGTLAVISMAITSVALTFGMKFFAPAIVAKLNSIPWLTNLLHATGLDQVGLAIGKTIYFKMKAVETAILLGVPGLTLTGTIVDRAWNKVKNWWDSTKKEIPQDNIEYTDEEVFFEEQNLQKKETVNLNDLSYKTLFSTHLDTLSAKIDVPKKLVDIKKIPKSENGGKENTWSDDVNPVKGQTKVGRDSETSPDYQVRTRTWKSDVTGQDIFRMTSYRFFNPKTVCEPEKKHALKIENLQTGQSLMVRKK